MSAPPRGTVALVFTDIQGSTALWERLGADFQEALDLHDAVLRAAAAAHGGYEVKNEGDAFFFAFSSAAAALSCCVDAQLGLAATRWPASLRRHAEGGLRVRMGFHVGEPICRISPVTGRMDYFGPVVNRSARVSAAAHGGQILLSARAVAEARAEDPGAFGGMILTCLGAFRLPGLEGEEDLWQVLGSSQVGARFPPPRVERGRALGGTGVAEPSAPFFGRSDELAALRVASDERVLALSGVAGCGKSRLALRFAATLEGDLPGGVVVVRLADAGDADGLLTAVADALRLGPADAERAARIPLALRERGPCLVLLDGCDACASAALALAGSWSRVAPEARFLLTSRARLGNGQLRVLPIDPLPVPEEGTHPAKILDNPAVALLLDRGRSSGARLPEPLEESVAESAAAIVRQLDGLPLAIELAAARLSMLSLSQLHARLVRRPDLLELSRGLRAALDASWSLLGPGERAALAQLTVFRGGFLLEHAEAVVDLSAHRQVASVLETLRALVAHSLVQRSSGEGEPRFVLLGVVSEHVGQRVDESPVLGLCREAAEVRHITSFAALAEKADQARTARSRASARRVLSAEQGNLRSALESAIHRADRAAVVRLAPPLLDMLLDQGPLLDAVALGERILAFLGPDSALTPGLRWRVGSAETRLGRVDLAEAELLAACDLARRAGDAAVEVRALISLGVVQRLRGALDEVQATLVKAEARLDERADPALAAELWFSWGNLERTRGDNAQAERHYHRALAAAQVASSDLQEGRIQNALGLLWHERGELERARPFYQRALALHRAIGNRRSEALVLDNLGILWRDLGDIVSAERCHRQALVIARAGGFLLVAGAVLGNLGILLLEAGDSGAEAALERCREIGLELNHVRMIAVSSAWLALLAARSGERARALALQHEADRVSPAVLGAFDHCDFLVSGAEVAWRCGDPDGARRRLAQAQELALGLGLKPGVGLAARLERCQSWTVDTLVLAESINSP